MAFTSRALSQNRWRSALTRGAELEGTDPRLLARAAEMRDDENTQKMRAGHNPLVGGYQWQEYEDFHKIRKNLAALQGNRYSLGPMSGGGDLNERSLDGSGPTQQIGYTKPTVSTATRAGQRSLPGTIQVGKSTPRPTATRATVAAGRGTGGIMDVFTDPTTGESAGWAAPGTPRRALQDLAMRQLYAQTNQLSAESDATQRELSPMFARGTPSFYNRQRQEASIEDDLTRDTMMSNARGTADAYEMYGREHAANQAMDTARTGAAIYRDPAVAGVRAAQRGEAETTARQEHRRQLERSMVNALPAYLASQSRSDATGATTQQRTLSAQIAAMRAEIGNARQYGDTDRVAELIPQLDAMLALQGAGGGTGGRASGPGPVAGGAPQQGGATPPRPPNAPPGAYYDPNGPDGPGWYVDDYE